jgi:hypothetical protein
MIDCWLAKKASCARRLMLSLAGLTGACSSATGVHNVSKIAVTPSQATLAVRDTVTLEAAVIAASGSSVGGVAVYWSSQDTTIASVSAAGLVTAHVPGRVTIAASSGGTSGEATITVSAAAIAALTVAPETLVVRVGATGQLRATARDASGKVVTGAPITWASSNGAVATVDSGGTVSGVAAGTATISAFVAGQLASATAIVGLPAPVTIAGCRGGTISESAVGDVTVVGNIEAGCAATISSAYGSIEIKGSVTGASSAALSAAQRITIDQQVQGGSQVQVRAGGAFTLGQGIAGAKGVTSNLTVFDSDTVAIVGDVRAGAIAKLYSRGPMTISGSVRDANTQVVWWGTTLTVVGAVLPPAQVVKQNWGGF